ncbi:phosphomevalonate kinase [Carnobacteriaceae bacterium zg-ZUI240]|nr:phosphomevalonate kinase [Carnobacteriaceae bacterium zg-ZUI240]
MKIGTSFHAKAPGKLFIAGEYAVTQPGHLAVISSVSRYLNVELIVSDVNEIYSDQLKDGCLEWARECGALVPLGQNPFPIITKTIETVEWYISELNQTPINFELHVTSQLDAENGTKYGLGSSGAVSVATIKVMLDAYAIAYTPLLVYQLAVITQLRLNSNGSFGDIAASSFDTLIAYSSVDKLWLRQTLENHSLIDVLNQDWKDLIIEPLVLPNDTAFLVGWTGKSASTQQLVDDIKKAHLNQASWQTFLAQSSVCVNQFIEALKASDILGIKNALNINRQLLQSLSQHIETPQLQRLITVANAHGFIAKTSGAGGGDCGIAFIQKGDNISDLLKDWKLNGITPLLVIGGQLHDECITFNT